ncbi:MAG: OmpH family outer membrane protein [Prevotella sp.]|nr:OmpH family outer membrane protein [Prevotella sp.]
MNKRNFLRLMAVTAMATLTLTACNDSNKMDDKPEKVAAQTATPGSLRIAYVEVDSIMTQYDFCKDYTKILEKRSNNSQSALAAQEKNLNAAVQNFQNKLQNNGFSSQREAEGQQAALQRQQEQLLATRDRLAGELQSQTEKFNQALHDSLDHFLAQYNKDKKYSMILAKSGDNILLADKALDITAEVVAGLNKSYKKKPDEKETKK